MLTNREQFDTDLDRLKKVIIQMGEKVEKAIMDGIHSLQKADRELAQAVIDGDEEINKIEEKIEAIGANLIATQQPVASDLRKILISFKMASDLERIGDLAVDIAKMTLRIGQEKLVKPLVDIPRMAEIVQEMIEASIRSYMDEDVELAYKMAKMDDQVDELHSQNLRELFSFIVDNPTVMNQVLNLCFVSRFLERSADYATNIGESVVYLVKGHRPDLN